MAFELVVRTGGHWFHRYFSLFGLNEVKRRSDPDDDVRQRPRCA
jgi:hypothetical protein